MDFRQNCRSRWLNLMSPTFNSNQRIVYHKTVGDIEAILASNNLLLCILWRISTVNLIGNIFYYHSDMIKRLIIYYHSNMIKQTGSNLSKISSFYFKIHDNSFSINGFFQGITLFFIIDLEMPCWCLIWSSLYDSTANLWWHTSQLNFLSCLFVSWTRV